MSNVIFEFQFEFRFIKFSDMHCIIYFIFIVFCVKFYIHIKKNNEKVVKKLFFGIIIWNKVNFLGHILNVNFEKFYLFNVQINNFKFCYCSIIDVYMYMCYYKIL